MGDKIAVAALGVTGVSFLVVLVSPPPKAAPKPGGQSAESMALLVQAEMNSMDQDRMELEALGERAAVLEERMQGRRKTGRQEIDRLVQLAAAREVARRLPEYNERLKTIKLYEKLKPKPKPKAQPQPKEQPKPGAKAEPKAKPKAKPKPEPQPRPKAKAPPKPKPQPDAEAQPAAE